VIKTLLLSFALLVAPFCYSDGIDKAYGIQDQISNSSPQTAATPAIPEEKSIEHTSTLKVTSDYSGVLYVNNKKVKTMRANSEPFELKNLLPGIYNLDLDLWHRGPTRGHILCAVAIEKGRDTFVHLRIEQPELGQASQTMQYVPYHHGSVFWIVLGVIVASVIGAGLFLRYDFGTPSTPI
jgi:hypothetical protein